MHQLQGAENPTESPLENEKFINLYNVKSGQRTGSVVPTWIEAPSIFFLPDNLIILAWFWANPFIITKWLL